MCKSSSLVLAALLATALASAPAQAGIFGKMKEKIAKGAAAVKSFATKAVEKVKGAAASVKMALTDAVAFFQKQLRAISEKLFKGAAAKMPNLAAVQNALRKAVGKPVRQPRRGVCNGSKDLCGRRLNEVTLLATHNSMATIEDGFLFGIAANHFGGITRQLNAGVRYLDIDIHTWKKGAGQILKGVVENAKMLVEILQKKGNPLDWPHMQQAMRNFGQGHHGAPVYACHSLCVFGSSLLKNELAKVAAFLAHNPEEVVVIGHESYVSATDLEKAYREAGLLPYVYTHPFVREGGKMVPGPWPTLREMIAKNKRVVVFAATNAGWVQDANERAYDGTTGKAKWILGVGTRGNGWGFKSTKDIDCWKDGGPSSLHDFSVAITNPVALPWNSKPANSFDFIKNKISECRGKGARHPSSVSVDYWEIGDAKRAVDWANATFRT